MSATTVRSPFLRPVLARSELTGVSQHLLVVLHLRMHRPPLDGRLQFGSDDCLRPDVRPGSARELLPWLDRRSCVFSSHTVRPSSPRASLALTLSLPLSTAWTYVQGFGPTASGGEGFVLSLIHI